MLYFPEPMSAQNLTARNSTICLNQTIKESSLTDSDMPVVQEAEIQWWHKIFWVSKVGWNSLLAIVLFVVTSKY